MANSSLTPRINALEDVAGGPIVATTSTYGAVKGGKVPGDTSGAAIAAGYVGEMLGTIRSGTNGFTYSTQATPTPTTSYSSMISVTLNKGTYLVSGYMRDYISATAIELSGEIRVGGTAVTTANLMSAPMFTDRSSGFTWCLPITITADSTAVALFAKINAGTANAGAVEMWTVRIA